VNYSIVQIVTMKWESFYNGIFSLKKFLSFVALVAVLSI
jgi:hypothetical protein